jgi:phosphatidylglycerol:prolipoprotein diacylglycerol transferase
VDPVAIRLGPFAVHWYGLAYLVGFGVAAWMVHYFAGRWKLGLTTDDVLNILLAAIAGVLIGGRLGYVLFYGGSYYLSAPARVLRIWDGGMSFHGGLVGILVAGAIMARVIGMPLLTLWDLGAIGAPVGFGLGRVANFINGELWGRVTTVAWGMVFPNAGLLPRHPSQLYEALLEGALLFVAMFLLARRLPPRPRGELVGWLLTLYGAFRIAVEFFREPDTQLGFLAAGWLTMGMVLSVPMVIAGVALITWARRRQLPQVGRSSNP